VRDLYNTIGLEKSGCKFCGSQNFQLLAESDRYGFDLQKQFCNDCGLVQTYPALKPEFHREFYSHHYRPLYTNSAKTVNYEKLINEQRAKGRHLLQYLSKHGLSGCLENFSLIEIGCSSGGILAELRPYFRNVQGCDLDVEGVAYARENMELDVEIASFPATLPKNQKIILISHVLEHLYDPLKILKEASGKMNEGDYLCVMAPGMNTVAKGAYKNDLRRFFHIAHVTDLTEGTLANLAAAACLSPIHIDQEIKSIFVRSKCENARWSKNPRDSIENVQRIERTYKGLL
jgi:SAM-dependent methyltransferase